MLPSLVSMASEEKSCHLICLPPIGEVFFFSGSFQYFSFFFLSFSLLLFIYLFCFLGPHPWHMKVPRLGAELELQLLVYTIATATLDLSHICNLHHSSRQLQILNPLGEARNWTGILRNISWVQYRWAMMGTPFFFLRLPECIHLDCSFPMNVQGQLLFCWWSNQSLEN